jgi:hypothetical protein
MNTNTAFDFDIDCPWCSGPMATTSESNPVAALTCPTCSIVIELAPDPVTVPVALAA